MWWLAPTKVTDVNLRPYPGILLGDLSSKDKRFVWSFWWHLLLTCEISSRKLVFIYPLLFLSIYLFLFLVPRSPRITESGARRKACCVGGERFGKGRTERHREVNKLSRSNSQVIREPTTQCRVCTSRDRSTSHANCKRQIFRERRHHDFNYPCHPSSPVRLRSQTSRVDQERIDRRRRDLGR